jgi:hypothetical protein
VPRSGSFLCRQHPRWIRGLLFLVCRLVERHWIILLRTGARLPEKASNLLKSIFIDPVNFYEIISRFVSHPFKVNKPPAELPLWPVTESFGIIL